ncbi:MAG: polysaccharide biosynthesis protein, partial [Anaerolineae bacterium]
HPDMTRYFMSVPEATQLVLQAGSFGKNGAIYILDMGDPVRIVDLAYDLIRLSGLEPGEDIPIEFIGKRPGEKLYEELRYEDEHPDASDHEKILVVRPQPLPEDFNDHLEALLIAARMSDPVRIREMLCSMIPAYEAQAEIAYAY